MLVHSNEKNDLFMFMFICRLLGKKYKELELSKLEFHNTRNSSLGSLSTIEEKKKQYTQVLYLQRTRAYKNSSLVSLSIVLHGTRVYQD